MTRATSMLPGPWTAVCGPAAWLLVDARPEDPRVGAAAAALAQAAPADDVLEALLSGGLRRLPAFALVAEQGVGLRVVVRGTATVGLDGATIACTAPTWQDTTLAATASTLVLDTGSSPTVGDPRTAPPGPVGASRLVVDLRPPAPQPEEPAPSHTVMRAGPRRAAGSPAPAAPPAPPTPAPPAPAADPVSASEAPTVLPAGARVAAPAPGRPTGAPGQGGALIHGVPGLPPPAPPVTRVHALSCPRGHLTPPFLDRCRVCGVPVPAGEPREIVRPPLGELRAPDGTPVVTLDADAVLGRSPHPMPGVGPAPHLVTIHADGVSRNHLHVALQDWLVLVRDLGSANGSEIQHPDRDPELLRPNEEYVLEPGTTVTLGGEARFTFVVTA